MALHQRGDHRSGHIVRACVLQCSARGLSGGGAQAIDNHGFVHSFSIVECISGFREEECVLSAGQERIGDGAANKAERF